MAQSKTPARRGSKALHEEDMRGKIPHNIGADELDARYGSGATHVTGERHSDEGYDEPVMEGADWYEEDSDEDSEEEREERSSRFASNEDEDEELNEYTGFYEGSRSY